MPGLGWFAQRRAPPATTRNGGPSSRRQTSQLQLGGRKESSLWGDFLILITITRSSGIIYLHDLAFNSSRSAFKLLGAIVLGRLQTLWPAFGPWRMSSRLEVCSQRTMQTKRSEPKWEEVAQYSKRSQLKKRDGDFPKKKKKRRKGRLFLFGGVAQRALRRAALPPRGSFYYNGETRATKNSRRAGGPSKPEGRAGQLSTLCCSFGGFKSKAPEAALESISF